MALSSPPAAPQRGDRATFAQRVDAFITWLISFVGELNIFSANLNSIAAGGAYAFPFTWGAVDSPGRASSWTYGGSTSQNTDTLFIIHNLDSRGRDANAILTALFSGVSSAKIGGLRVESAVDQSRYLVYEIEGLTFSGNRTFNVRCIGSSSANPFSTGDAVILFFQRTGDKGDTGPVQTLRTMIVRGQYSAGVAAQSLTGGQWTTRNLNTVAWNDIAGASLSNNLISLPAGTYWIDAEASIAGGGANILRIFDVTSNGIYDIGIPGKAYYGEVVTCASVRTMGTLTSTKQLRVDHYLATGNAPGGSPAGVVAEIYTEVKITKIA